MGRERGGGRGGSREADQWRRGERAAGRGGGRSVSGGEVVMKTPEEEREKSTPPFICGRRPLMER